MISNTFLKIEGLAQSNIYEVNLRQYTSEGSFRAFSEHLPRLREMGIEILWFMPLTPISQKKRKGGLGSYYACSDYCSVNPEFGTIGECQDLFKMARDMGFKVIIDWVANHTGWDHTWTRTNPDYYLIDEATHDFKAASGMDDIIELNYDNPSLRRAMIDAMSFWVREFGIDGFRCDLAFWVRLDFWMEARQELEKEKTLFWFGEFDPIDHPDYYQAFDAAYTWTWMHRTEAFCKGNSAMGNLREVLYQYEECRSPGTFNAWFTSNHDENSWNGTEYEKYGEAAKALAVFSVMWPGIPLIYSGQEIPNRKRLEFFEKEVLPWEQGTGLSVFYGTILSFRKNNSALDQTIPGSETRLVNTNQEDAVLVYLRKNSKDEVWVLLNLSGQELRVDPTEYFTEGNYRELFSQVEQQLSGACSFDLKPWDHQVWEKTGP